MNAKKIFVIMIMTLFPAFTGFAADSTFEGDATLLGEHANIDGNKAKYNEYRDIRSNGLYGGFDFNYDSKDPFLNGKASDIGYDTQHYRLDGGRYGKFHFFLDYNEIPHNITYDAKTFYSNPGSNNLVFPSLPSTDTSSWSNFDYSIKRKKGEGGFRLDYLRPFYFDISASREERTGIKPTGVAATTPGGIALELPEPVDYTTDTVKFEVGYGKKPVFASLDFVYGNFNNKNTAQFFNNPAGPQPNTDAINLPPDNQYYKLSFKGNVRLPLNSRFNVNAGSSRTTSEADLFTSYVSTGITNISLSDSIFNGKIDTQHYNAVLTSNPWPFLTGKIYYKYYNRQNKSDQITTSDPNFNGGTPFVNKLFEYRKNSYGMELGFRMPDQLSLQTAYSYLQTDRARGDFPETRDHTYSAELKWNGLDFIVPKVAYERLQRGADHGVLIKESAADQNTENAIEPFIGRFDASPQDRDTLKVSVEIYPLSNLNFDIGYRYTRTDYKDTVLGLRNVKSDEIYVDAGYSMGQIAQLNVYGSYEKNRTYQFQRRFDPLPPTGTGDPDPSGTQDANNYNWDVVMKDDSFSYGANAEIFIVPRKVTLVLQYDDIKSNGHADFTYYSSAALIAGGRTNDDVDIGAWDDYTLRSLSAKIKYSPSKTYTLSAGYAYERYTYNDASWDNYMYTSGPLPPAATTSNSALLTGAYANPNYHANVVFLAASYRF
jgi:MtrB/PioB family decaheme-associated outer membrane protein